MHRFTNSPENFSFTPSRYIRYINTSPSLGLISVVWEKLFNTNQRLGEIVDNASLDMEYDTKTEGSNRIMTYKLNPDLEIIRTQIYELLESKWSFLKNLGLSDRQAYEVFKSANFKYLNSIPDFIKDEKLRNEIIHDLKVIEELKREPKFDARADITLKDEPRLTGSDLEPISSQEPSFKEAQELPTLETIQRLEEEDKLRNAGVHPVIPENVISDQVITEIEEKRSLLKSFVKRLFGKPEAVDTEKTTLEQEIMSENQESELNKENVDLSRRRILKGLIAVGALSAAGIAKGLDSDEIKTDEDETNEKPNLEPNNQEEQVPQEKDNQEEQAPQQEEAPQEKEEEAAAENQEVLSLDERLRLIEDLKAIISEYSDLKGKQSYDLLTEDLSNSSLKKVLEIIRKVNLSSEELQDLKLIRSVNLKRFDEDLSRLEKLYDHKMCNSDNWIIKILLEQYKKNPQEMQERFEGGKFYEALKKVCASMKREKIEGHLDVLNEFDFLSKVVFDPNFIEGILMRECGFRANNYNPLVCTEITRSMIDSGKWNPGFGSIVNGKIRVALNHILTFWFLRGGPKNEGGTINNKFVRKYFNQAGVLSESNKFKLCSKFDESLPNLSVNAPTEQKIAQMLMNPEDSVRLTLLSFRENLHYTQSTIRKNLERFQIFNKLLSDEFWVKMVALSNIAGGPGLNAYMKKLATYPGFYSIDDITGLDQKSRNHFLQNFGKAIKFSGLKNGKQLEALNKFDYNNYFKVLLREFKKMHAKSVKIKTVAELSELSSRDKQKIMNWYKKLSSEFYNDYAVNVNLLLQNISETPHEEPSTIELDLGEAQALSNTLNLDNL